MTYCVAVAVDEGLVFLSDSRTNAGVDHVSTFRKMNFFEMPGERVIVIMGSGNLSITQSVLGLLRRRLTSAGQSILTQKTMGDTALMVGEVVRDIFRRDAEALRAQGIDFNAEFIIGGEIRGERPRLFHMYAAGNFIETTEETRYFQIGEAKYGKPIIDRVVRADSSLATAAKCLLISMDSTIRSNLSVGMPLDLAVLRRGEQRVTVHRNIGADDAYFKSVREGWGEALRSAFHDLPDLEVPAAPAT
jgi:putative proteasome-type protease